METILRKVKTAKRLPKDSKYYFTDIGEMIFRKDQFYYPTSLLPVKTQPEYWYEEISISDLLRDAFESARFKEFFTPKEYYGEFKYETFEEYIKNKENE